MTGILVRTAQQAIINTAEMIGEKAAIDLFRNALPQLETQLTVMQSATGIESAAVAAEQIVSYIRIYGSGDLEQLLVKLLNKRYSSEQLPAVIRTVSTELKTSVKEIENWLHRFDLYR